MSYHLSSQALTALLSSLQPKVLAQRGSSLWLHPSLLLVPLRVLIYPSHQTPLHLQPSSAAPKSPHLSSNGSAAAVPQVTIVHLLFVRCSHLSSRALPRNVAQSDDWTQVIVLDLVWKRRGTGCLNCIPM